MVRTGGNIPLPPGTGEIATNIVGAAYIIESSNDVLQAQLLSPMKLTGKRIDFLINFNVAVIKYGIKRMIL
jgi:hypothetical protein